MRNCCWEIEDPLDPLVAVGSQHDKLQEGIALTRGNELQDNPLCRNQPPEVDLEPPLPEGAVASRFPVGGFVVVEQVCDPRGVAACLESVGEGHVGRVFATGRVAPEMVHDIAGGIRVFGHEMGGDDPPFDFYRALRKLPLLPVRLAVDHDLIAAHRSGLPPRRFDAEQGDCGDGEILHGLRALRIAYGYEAENMHGNFA